MHRAAKERLRDSPLKVVFSHDTVLDIRLELIELFIHLARVIGVPRSVGEIYGFIFSSAVPVAFEEVVSGLCISNGSASRGLRTLRTIGAIATTYIAGDRRDFYTAETDFRKLAGGLFKALLDDQLQNGETRLVRLADLVSSLDGRSPTARSFLADRVNQLRVWHRRARTTMPTILDLLESQASAEGSRDEIGAVPTTETVPPPQALRSMRAPTF